MSLYDSESKRQQALNRVVDDEWSRTIAPETVPSSKQQTAQRNAQWTKGGALWASDLRRERRRRAAATGDPLVDGLPHDFAGQLTVTVGGCWQWHGRHNDAGYPMYRASAVYRLLFPTLRGPFDPDKELHHQCLHEWCANPWHTIPMTTAEHDAEHARLLKL